jgi:predicted ATP-dependent endonuclease of OLD family
MLKASQIQGDTLRKVSGGGKSKASAFEEDTFNYINVVYLPALRNAEEKLTNGKKSRLALLLKHQYKSNDRQEELVSAFNDFNKSVIENKEKKFDEIEKARKDINTAMKESMGSVFSQSVSLRFSENSFSSILQSIKMVFFPTIGEMDDEKFRDVAINSLGYNNLLYIATVFAELEAINNNLFTVLLIEEPEAHLHPQIQSKLIKYLQKLSEEKKNLQIILTTHSAVLASSVSIETIIHVTGTKTGISVKKISDFQLEDNIKNYLNRWMDITKSTLLFSKGVILVEGICEAMLLPAFAPLVLSEYNKTHQKKLPATLEEAGVTVVNINGINFKYFYPLFCDMDGKEDRLPIWCSGITDRDPLPDIEKDDNGKIIRKEEKYPIKNEKVVGGNEAINLENEINKTKRARLFISPFKTFEYDLAMSGNFSIMAEILEEKWPKDGGEQGVKNQCKQIKDRNSDYTDVEQAREDAKYIYKHIDCDNLGKGIFSQALLEKIEKKKELVIPEYIKKAIFWACGGNCD